MKLYDVLENNDTVREGDEYCIASNPTVWHNFAGWGSSTKAIYFYESYTGLGGETIICIRRTVPDEEAEVIYLEGTTEYKPTTRKITV